MVLRGSQLRDSESNSSQSGGGVSSSASSAAASKRSSSQAESESDQRMSEDESRPFCFAEYLSGRGMVDNLPFIVC